MATYRLLILDTETTDVHPSKGQVIEVAGAIAEIDTITLETKSIKNYQSLVALREAKFTKKIKDLTGIDELELAEAPEINKVQREWSDWLGDDKIDYIIGHSLSFDTTFLSSEGWYIPDSIDQDTLDYAKILLPQAQAINLEYLIQHLDLVPIANKIFDKTIDPDDHHRALVDVELTAALYQELLKKLVKTPQSEEFKAKIKDLFSIDLEYFTSNKAEEKTLSKAGDLSVFWSGLVKNIAYKDRLDAIDSDLDTADIYEVIDGFDNQVLARNVLQIDNALNYNSSSLHLHQGVEYKWADIVVSYLEKEQGVEYQVGELPLLEKLISEIPIISNKRFNLSELMDYAEIASQVWPELKTANDNLHSSVEFLLAVISPILDMGSYKYNPHQDLMEGHNIGPRIQTLASAFGEFVSKFEKIQDKQGFRGFVHEYILAKLDSLKSFDLNTKQKMTINVRSQIQIFADNPQFNLANHFDSITNKYPELKIRTYLNQEDALSLAKILGVGVEGDRLDTINTEGWYKVEYANTRDDLEIELVRLHAANSLVLVHNNKGLRDLETALAGIDVDYLMYGDTSITKIMSKIKSGYKGLVIVRVGDYDKLSVLGLDGNFVSVVVFNSQYIYPNQWLTNKWGTRVKEATSNLSKLVNKSWLNRLSKSHEEVSNLIYFVRRR